MEDQKARRLICMTTLPKAWKASWHEDKLSLVESSAIILGAQDQTYKANSKLEVIKVPRTIVQ